MGFHKDFRIESDRIPTEFTLLFDSMKIELKNQKDQIRMVGLIQEIGDNLGILEKEQIYFLLKSEVIRNVLEHKFDKIRDFDLTLQLMERLEKKFEANKKYLSSFSQWIQRSIIAELNYRKKIGLISNKSFNPSLFLDEKKDDAAKLARFLKYLMPWIERILSLNSSQFNQLSTQISWVILERVNDRSLFFKRFSSSLVSNTKIRLFNIPQKLLDVHPETIKNLQNQSIEEESLEEKSNREKNEAIEMTKKVDIKDMSTVSDDVINAIEQKSN
jgi:hypothetical protein